jgi:hypothetical protein
MPTDDITTDKHDVTKDKHDVTTDKHDVTTDKLETSTGKLVHVDLLINKRVNYYAQFCFCKCETSFEIMNEGLNCVK